MVHRPTEDVAMIENVPYGTDFVALAAVASPWWLDQVEHVSQGAAMLLPMLGVIWITMQIINFILNRKKKP
jgi:hypothetical protein